MTTQFKVQFLATLTISFLTLASTASAKIIFSEIMYDLEEGSDSGREWVEIFNSSTSAVSLLSWKFYEGESNHGLVLEQGSESLGSGEYALIVSNPSKFLLDWPQFSGTLFDSSFSLNNTGETFVIRDSELVDIDSVTYTLEWGASGDGNTLYYTGDFWSAGVPTPGTGTLSAVQMGDNSDQGSGQETPPPVSPTSSAGNFTVEQQIVALAGEDRVVTVGADSLFKGEALGIAGKKLENARYIWNFGDGTRKEGHSVLHYYRYPGDYVVTLDVSSGEYSASDRINVSANVANVIISRGTQEVITITNLDENELNLSWWKVAVGSESFMLPEHTIILPQHEIHLSSDITGLRPNDSSAVILQYPNGVAVEINSPEYSRPQFESVPIQSTPRTSSRESIVGTEVFKDKVPTEQVGVWNEMQSNENNDYSQTSSVAKSTQTKDSGSAMFWLALASMVVLGSVSAIALRRKHKDEITIIE